MLIDYINTNITINTWYRESKLPKILKRPIARHKRDKLRSIADKYINLPSYSNEDLVSIFKYCFAMFADNDDTRPPYIKKLNIVPIGTDGSQIVAVLRHEEDGYKHIFGISITVIADFIDMDIDIKSVSPNGHSLNEHKSRVDYITDDDVEGYMGLLMRGLNGMISEIISFCIDYIFTTYERVYEEEL